MKSRALRWALVFGALAVLAVVYALADPASGAFFPKCPFKLFTGLNCPGCGSQRAVHALLNLDLAAAWRANPLLVAAIPYLIGGFVLDMLKHPSPRALLWKRRLYGGAAIWIVFALILAFWIARNIPGLGMQN